MVNESFIDKVTLFQRVMYGVKMTQAEETVKDVSGIFLAVQGAGNKEGTVTGAS